LRILKALQCRVLCACEIRELLQLANSTVSQHLAVLKEAGFISESKDGRWMNFMINSSPDDPRIDSILSALDYWMGDAATVKSDKKKIAGIDRRSICCG
jgi:ArsR family transcriptional regulator